ncbi:MAG TPA: putative metal-dependent hydrolase, partial [Pyrinomonadaceae bacterium]|nr:putative metal-dependent hydrolase [Pyrinomonadaceae bacterium]
MSDPRYPIGQFQLANENLSDEDRAQLIAQVAAAPQHLRAAVADLNDAQLDTSYRAGGWTVRQLVHHVADSHINGYIRVKLALAEDVPTIKPYDENVWVKLGDTPATPIETSLNLLDALHERWANLFRSLTPAEFARTFRHPELGTLSLNKQLA